MCPAFGSRHPDRMNVGEVITWHRAWARRRKSHPVWMMPGHPWLGHALDWMSGYNERAVER